jgi:hypothetical protein
MATANTGNPYLVPYPVSSEVPDVPRDIRALAERVHTQLAAIDSNVTAIKKATDSKIDQINTFLRTPDSSTTNILTAASGFTCAYQRLWRWGNMVSVEFTMTTTSDRSSSTGNIAETRMGTWKTPVVPVEGDFALTSLIDGIMAMGYISPAGITLSTIEAGGKWVKNSKIRFAGTYMTAAAR